MKTFDDEVTTPPFPRRDSVLKRTSDFLASSPFAILAAFAAYLLLQTALRPFLPPALRIDEAQQILFDQWHALGYDAQPPLYNWYQQALFALFGTSITTIAVAKNIILFLIFAAYVATARLVLTNNRLIAVAALALFTIPQVFWQAQRDLTHTSMLMLCMIGLLWATIRLLRTPSTFGYILVGAMAGLALLSKYNAVIILPAVVYAAWRHPQGRERLLDRRLLLSAAVALLVFLPHAIWLIGNFELASEITLKRMAENAPTSRLLQMALGLANFLTGSLVILIVPAILIGLALRGGGRLERQKTDSNAVWYRFFRDYFIGLSLLMLVIIVAMTITEIRDRWLLPMLIPFPLLAALWLEQRNVDLQRFMPRFVIAPGLLFIVIPIAIVVSSPLLAAVGERSRSNYDWMSFRRHLETVEKVSPAAIVTSNWSTGGNLRFIYADLPVVTTTYGDFTPPLNVTDERPLLLVQVGGLDGYREMEEWIREHYQLRIIRMSIKSVDTPMYFDTDEEAVRFNYALIRPGDLAKAE